MEANERLRVYRDLVKFEEGREGLRPASHISGVAARITEASLQRDGSVESSLLDDGALQLSLSQEQEQEQVLVIHLQMNGRLDAWLVDGRGVTTDQFKDTTEGVVWGLVRGGLVMDV